MGVLRKEPISLLI